MRSWARKAEAGRVVHDDTIQASEEALRQNNS
jgi:hypothetical protein